MLLLTQLNPPLRWYMCGKAGRRSSTSPRRVFDLLSPGHYFPTPEEC